MNVHCVIGLVACAALGVGCFNSSGGGNPPDAGGEPGIDAGGGPGLDAGPGSGLDGGAGPGSDSGGPSDDASSGEGGATTPCTLTWSGQVNATSACTASGFWDTTTNQGNITLAISGTSVVGAIGLDLTAAPGVGTFTLDTLAVGTNIGVNGAGGMSWAAEKPSTTYEQGSIMLTVTAVTPTVNVGGTQDYEVHGSLTSVLGPETVINFVDGSADGTVTSTGMVNLTGTF
jgi:hypothetical protein